MSMTFHQENQPHFKEKPLHSFEGTKTFVPTEIFNTLKKDTEKEECVKTQEKYQTLLEGADFLTPHDWKLLTTIEQYAGDLMEHSIETFRLAQKKIERIRIDDRALAEIIQDEVPLETFYRACLLHDIGKTVLPKSIVQHVPTPGDWHALTNMFVEGTYTQKTLSILGLSERDIATHTIEDILKMEAISPTKTVPVCELFSAEVLEELSNCGISLDSTLKEVLELHEKASEEILQSEGLPIEASIAGQHHNYKKSPYHFPLSSKTLGVSADLSDLLRLADEEQALKSKRPYKQPFSRLSVFECLIDDALKGAVSKELTALWISQDLGENPPTTETEDDTKKMAKIRNFLDEFTSHSTH